MIHKINMNKYFCFSLFLHFVLSLLFFTMTTSPKHTLPNQKKISVAAFLTENTYEKKMNIAERTKLSKSLQNKSRLHKNVIAEEKSEEKIETILAALHQAISERQQYPDSALEQHQTGTTKISFTLFSDGHIEQANISQSSGSNTLDIAALAAVQATHIDPSIAKSVRPSKLFMIDIVFS